MKVRHLCSLFMTILLLCAGCADTPEETEPQPTYAYTEAYQRIQEPYASGFAFQGNLM